MRIKAGRYKLDTPELDTGVRGNADFRWLWSSRKWGNISPHATALNLREMLTASTKWDEQMARKTYRIELKIDFSDETRHDAMLEVVKQYVRDLLGSAMLLQDGKRPACVLHMDDSFLGVDEIDILEPSDNLHEP